MFNIGKSLLKPKPNLLLQFTSISIQVLQFVVNIKLKTSLLELVLTFVFSLLKQRQLKQIVLFLFKEQTYQYVVVCKKFCYFLLKLELG